MKGIETSELLYAKLKPYVEERDDELLRACCKDYAIMVECESVISRFGVLKEDQYGTLKPNPAVSLRKQAHADFISAMKQLKLTPASRGKSTQEVADIDILEGL